MRIRSALVAAASAATLVVGAVAAHADNINVDADTLTAGSQTALELGTVACGVPATRTVDVWVNKNGSGTNAFGNGSTVDVTASTAAPLEVAVPSGTVGDIAIPPDWSALAQNTDSAKVRVTVTVTSSTAGAGSGTITFAGTGVNGSGASLIRSAEPDRLVDHGVVCAGEDGDDDDAHLSDVRHLRRLGLTPCTAATTGDGGFTATPTISYGANTSSGPVAVTATYAGDDTHEGSSDTTSFLIAKAGSTTTVTCEAGPFVYSDSPFTPCTATVIGAGGLSETLEVSYNGNTYAGTAGAEAFYGGDVNHEPSSGSATFTIDKAPTTVTVSCPDGPYYFTGSPITPACTARATGAGGLDEAVTPVTFENNEAVGDATASATYPGDDNHLERTGTTTFPISAWTLDGFFKPVDLNGVWNTVKNGSTVPLKFRVFSGSTELTSTNAVKAFSVQQVNCSTNEPQDAIEELATTGGTSLRYDTTGAQFVQNWQTPKKAGTCYRATMTTQDGSTSSAKFMLK